MIDCRVAVNRFQQRFVRQRVSHGGERLLPFSRCRVQYAARQRRYHLVIRDFKML